MKKKKKLNEFLYEIKQFGSINYYNVKKEEEYYKEESKAYYNNQEVIKEEKPKKEYR